MCDWAAAELTRHGPISGLRTKRKQQLVVEIKAVGESLRHSQTAFHFERDGPEKFFPYNSQKAEEVRQRLAANKKAE